MNILEFLLSKKILVVLSGLVFTGAALASSGAESLFQENGLVANETKIPEVQNITNAENSPSPTLTTQQTPAKSSSTPIPTPKPIITTSIPIASTTPKPKISASPSSSPTTITGLRQSRSEDEEEDESDESEINEAFQKAKEDTKEED